MAGNNNNTLKSTAKIEPTCLISTNNVDFGIVTDSELVTLRSFPGKVKIVDSTLNLRCTKNSNIFIYQDGGKYFDGNANYLKNNNSLH